MKEKSMKKILLVISIISVLFSQYRPFNSEDIVIEKRSYEENIFGRKYYPTNKLTTSNIINNRDEGKGQCANNRNLKVVMDSVIYSYQIENDSTEVSLTGFKITKVSDSLNYYIVLGVFTYSNLCRPPESNYGGRFDYPDERDMYRNPQKKFRKGVFVALLEDFYMIDYVEYYETASKRIINGCSKNPPFESINRFREIQEIYPPKVSVEKNELIIVN